MLYSQKQCDYYPALENVITLFDTGFLICFSLEMACKVAARGFLWHKHKYLRDTANWLDFIIVVFGIISEVVDSIDNAQLQELGFINVLRLVKVFRPLRFAS